MLPTPLTQTAAQVLRGDPGVHPSLCATPAPSPPATGIGVLGAACPTQGRTLGLDPASCAVTEKHGPRALTIPFPRLQCQWGAAQ